MKLVILRANELVPYDSARVATFEPNGTYLMVGGSAVGSDLEKSPLAEVKNEGKTVIRRLVTRSDGLFSGVDPGSDMAQVAEALAPITGREGVFGALCLGRKGGMGFGDKDIPALQELGAIAGVAVENSRILKKVSGQADKVTSALDSLSEISQALTTTTQGTAALEQKTLEVAARLGGGTHALLSQVSGEDRNRIIAVLGFPAAFVGKEISNGQGVIGAVALRQPAAAGRDRRRRFLRPGGRAARPQRRRPPRRALRADHEPADLLGNAGRLQPREAGVEQRRHPGPLHPGKPGRGRAQQRRALRLQQSHDLGAGQPD